MPSWPGLQWQHNESKHIKGTEQTGSLSFLQCGESEQWLQSTQFKGASIIMIAHHHNFVHTWRSVRRFAMLALPLKATTMVPPPLHIIACAKIYAIN